MVSGVYRPIICPRCGSDIVRKPEDECLTAAHCTTCGCNFLLHLPHNTRDLLTRPHR